MPPTSIAPNISILREHMNRFPPPVRLRTMLNALFHPMISNGKAKRKVTLAHRYMVLVVQKAPQDTPCWRAHSLTTLVGGIRTMRTSPVHALLNICRVADRYAPSQGSTY